MRKSGEFYVCDKGTCFSKTPSLPCWHDAGGNFPVIELTDNELDPPRPMSLDLVDIQKRMKLYNRRREEHERERRAKEDFEELKLRLSYTGQRKTNGEWGSPFGQSPSEVKR